MKQKRYWLRGGIGGAIIFVSYFIYQLTSPLLLDCTGPGCHSPKSFGNILFNIKYIRADEFLIILGHLLIVFLVGAFFGWIYRKIKNRNVSEVS